MNTNTQIIPAKSTFLSPLFLFQAAGIVAEACHELFLKDKTPSSRVKRVANVINAGVLGWRVFSRIKEAHKDFTPLEVVYRNELWTEIKFKQTDPMYLLVKNWVSKYASFIDPNAEVLTIDLKNNAGIIREANAIIVEDIDQFNTMSLERVVIPAGEVFFEWNGFSVEFAASTKKEGETATQGPQDTDASPFEKEGDKARKRWQEAFAPMAALRISTRDKAVLDALFDEIKRNVTLAEEKPPTLRKPYVYVYSSNYDEWNGKMEVPERSAILPEAYDKALLDDVTQFFTNKAWYQSVAIPHRRGYMFYGLPGTGKTSTIITLARQAGLDVYIINLNKLGNASDFEKAVNTADCGHSKGSILVFEDIDCVISNRDLKTAVGNKKGEENSEEKETLTFSEFLNVIDGITSREDQIVIMTTNKGLDDFDDALMRPGRIDVKVHFTYATEYQTNKLVERFVADKTTAAKLAKELKGKGKLTMCEVQEFLIQWHFGQTKSL